MPRGKYERTPEMRAAQAARMKAANPMKNPASAKKVSDFMKAAYAALRAVEEKEEQKVD